MAFIKPEKLKWTLYNGSPETLPELYRMILHYSKSKTNQYYSEGFMAPKEYPFDDDKADLIFCETGRGAHNILWEIKRKRFKWAYIITSPQNEEGYCNGK
jgi:hypothetical protein